MKILSIYTASEATPCFCYQAKVFAVYPNSEVMITYIRGEWVGKYFTKIREETKHENS